MAKRVRPTQHTSPAIAVEPVLAPVFYKYGNCKYYTGATYGHCSWCELKSVYAHSFICDDCQSFILK